jgi:hypothetical protein
VPVEAAKITEEIDELVVREVWYALNQSIQLGLQEVELLKVLGRAELTIEEAPRYHLARRDLGDHKLAVTSLEAPALLGYFGVAGAAEDGLVGRGLDLRAAGTAHAARLDVMDLQVPGGSTDLAAGIGGDIHGESSVANL